VRTRDGGVDGIPKWQAQLTFKMTRHAIVDLTQVFNTSPLTSDGQRLSTESLRSCAALGSSRMLLSTTMARADLGRVARNVRTLSGSSFRLSADAGAGWLPKKRAVDNWQTSAWEVAAAREEPFRKCMLEERKSAPQKKLPRTKFSHLSQSP
jgi:hypothetical protein